MNTTPKIETVALCEIVPFSLRVCFLAFLLSAVAVCFAQPPLAHPYSRHANAVPNLRDGARGRRTRANDTIRAAGVLSRTDRTLPGPAPYPSAGCFNLSS